MAAFESLSSRLQNVFSKLKGKGKVSENDVAEAMREVRLALLEADVNFKVVKDFRYQKALHQAWLLLISLIRN